MDSQDGQDYIYIIDTGSLGVKRVKCENLREDDYGRLWNLCGGNYGYARGISPQGHGVSTAFECEKDALLELEKYCDRKSVSLIKRARRCERKAQTLRARRTVVEESENFKDK